MPVKNSCKMFSLAFKVSENNPDDVIRNNPSDVIRTNPSDVIRVILN